MQGLKHAASRPAAIPPLGRVIYHEHFLLTEHSLASLVAQKARINLEADFIDTFYERNSSPILLVNNIWLRKRVFNHPVKIEKWTLKFLVHAGLHEGEGLHYLEITDEKQVIAFLLKRELRIESLSNIQGTLTPIARFRTLRYSCDVSPADLLVTPPSAAPKWWIDSTYLSPTEMYTLGTVEIDVSAGLPAGLANCLRQCWIAALEVIWSVQSKVIAFLAMRKPDMLKTLPWVEDWMRDLPTLQHNPFGHDPVAPLVKVVANLSVPRTSPARDEKAPTQSWPSEGVVEYKGDNPTSVDE